MRDERGSCTAHACYLATLCSNEVETALRGRVGDQSSLSAPQAGLLNLASLDLEVYPSPLLASHKSQRPPMYTHLGQGPDAATSSLADFLTDAFTTAVPISTSQVESSAKTVAVLPPTQVTLPEVPINSSPEVSLVLDCGSQPVVDT